MFHYSINKISIGLRERFFKNRMNLSYCFGAPSAGDSVSGEAGASVWGAVSTSSGIGTWVFGSIAPPLFWFGSIIILYHLQKAYDYRFIS